MHRSPDASNEHSPFVTSPLTIIRRKQQSFLYQNQVWVCLHLFFSKTMGEFMIDGDELFRRSNRGNSTWTGDFDQSINQSSLVNRSLCHATDGKVSVPTHCADCTHNAVYISVWHDANYRDIRISRIEKHLLALFILYEYHISKYHFQKKKFLPIL